MAKLSWPAAERNKWPILELLRIEFSEPARVLEIASGTGQHAIHFASHLPHLDWQPTDIDPENRASIDAWRREASLRNLRASLHLDVLESNWPVTEVDAVFNANMIHIAPWECAIGLFRGAAKAVRNGGKLILYGPFRIRGDHTAPSNASFDESLKERDPSWGVRDLEAVIDLARSAEFNHARTVAMPANNQLVVFEKTI